MFTRQNINQPIQHWTLGVIASQRVFETKLSLKMYDEKVF